MTYRAYINEYSLGVPGTGPHENDSDFVQVSAQISLYGGVERGLVGFSVDCPSNYNASQLQRAAMEAALTAISNTFGVTVEERNIIADRLG